MKARRYGVTWHHEERQHRTRNYRVMFKSALVCVAISAVIIAIGGIRALLFSDVEILAFGLLMLVGSVGSAYLTVDSTVRVIEQDMKELDTRSE
jgi:hypothetical protein